MARRNESGFDPDEVVRMGRRAQSAIGARIKWFLLIPLLLLAAWTTYFQVEPEEVAVVTRFGAYRRTVQPGPAFKLPFGIDRAYKVPVQRQLKEEFGFRTVRADVSSEYAKPEAATKESAMLTGDLNVATVEWIVQYKIDDPLKFLFRVRNVGTTFRDISEAAMRSVVGDHAVTEVLTVGRERIQVQAKEELQTLCDHYDTGIKVLQLVLQDVNPPEAVKASFNEVNQAEQERERAENEAWSEYNRAIPTARGQAAQLVKQAEGDAIARVNNANGDVARFAALATEYQKAPRVTRTRLYLESMAQVLPAAGRRVVLDASMKGMLPLLNLGDGAVGGAK
jgi:membrane protease subunit HflK